MENNFKKNIETRFFFDIYFFPPNSIKTLSEEIFLKKKIINLYHFEGDLEKSTFFISFNFNF